MRNSKTSKPSSVTAQTEKSVYGLLHHSFAEMFRLAQINHDITFKEIKPEYIDQHNLKSIMFTVSSSNFRIVILLHFLPKAELASQHNECLNIDVSSNEQRYHDYVCELGNNFCGVICRVLGSAGFSTGMSTPNILANARSILNMQSVGMDFETHIGAFSGSLPILCASCCLFVNKGLNIDLNIPIPNVVNAQEALGELEFF
ncbi:MAG TPA: hypothetical protein PKC70_01475 [Cellvibrionaceae bacterium]|nr:hypothetical protein [Cellvibrionaceae bacterium]